MVEVAHQDVSIGGLWENIGKGTPRDGLLRNREWLRPTSAEHEPLTGEGYNRIQSSGGGVARQVNPALRTNTTKPATASLIKLLLVSLLLSCTRRRLRRARLRRFKERTKGYTRLAFYRGTPTV